MGRLADRDRRQVWRDKFFPPRGYKLDDRFVLRDGRRHPFALICPGGGYHTICSYIEGTPIARRLNARGVSAFILYYRVREHPLYPTPMDDLARAVGEILERAEAYNVIRESYSVWGFSAGGHLAASFGTANLGYPIHALPRPAALVLGYPVISMMEGLTHPGSHDHLLGAGADRGLDAFASVERHVTAEYPPTYIWCGDADGTVSPDNTRAMVGALEAAGVTARWEIFPGVDHGIGPGTGTRAEGWMDRAVGFWMEKMGGE